ncbi:MAG: hypothetical protein QM820_60595 [Minicystis sp.]
MIVFLALGGLAVGCADTSPVGEPVAEDGIAARGGNGRGRGHGLGMGNGNGLGNGAGEEVGEVCKGQHGTTLFNATKTATPYNERRISYDWQVTKTAAPTSIPAPGTGVPNYLVTATRSVLSDQNITGASGQICVTNAGAIPTIGLAIEDVVSCRPISGGGGFQLTASTNVDVSSHPVLNPGERECYDYKIDFSPRPGQSTTCKNTANITITNHSGSLGTPFGPSPKSPAFTLPSTGTSTVETYPYASVSDTQTCPDGFTCSPVPANILDISEGTSGPTGFLTPGQPFIASVQLGVGISANTGTCGSTPLDLVNKATLTSTSPGEMDLVRSASVTVLVTPPACPCTGSP